ncbi:MAG: hypothetical protein NC489_21655 [Ruminococcus flavefaciens]|nr:hypothetical protein [Ruminococcus flavefaciens]
MSGKGFRVEVPIGRLQRSKLGEVGDLFQNAGWNEILTPEAEKMGLLLFEWPYDTPPAVPDYSFALLR